MEINISNDNIVTDARTFFSTLEEDSSFISWWRNTIKYYDLEINVDYYLIKRNGVTKQYLLDSQLARLLASFSKKNFVQSFKLISE